MFAYLIIRGNDIELVPSDTHEFTLEELYAGCSCDTIQIVRSGCDPHLLMCIDDNGKILQKYINPLGTMLYYPEFDFIVGDVVLGTSVSPYPDDEPDIYKMEYEQALVLKNLLEEQ